MARGSAGGLIDLILLPLKLIGIMLQLLVAMIRLHQALVDVVLVLTGSERGRRR